MPKEIWKDICGYEGYYQVSDFGNLKSVDRIIKHHHGKLLQKKGRPLTQFFDKYGYLKVSLSMQGIQRTERVHRLVAKAFIENPNNFPIINHKDENKTNNNVKNLEWCTPAYNVNYNGAAVRGGISRRIPINQYTKDFDFIKRWEGRFEIENFYNFDGSSISKCCIGKAKSAYGYIWEYAEPEKLKGYVK
jgi:hypothetical protein